MDIAYDLTTEKLSPLKLDVDGFYLENYVVSNSLSKAIVNCANFSQPFFGGYSFDYNTQIIKTYYGLPIHDWI